MASFLLWFITVTLMLLGVVGTIVPALPGLGLVFAGILVYAIATQFSTIQPLTIAIFGVVAFLGWFASFLGSAWGARAGGGKTAALIGAIGGAIGGLMLIGPPGLVLGAFLGALAGALIAGQKQEEAVKVATYSVLGIIGGAVMQFLLSIALIIAFIVAVVA